MKSNQVSNNHNLSTHNNSPSLLRNNKEAQKFLGVSETTLWRLRTKDKAIKFRKIRGQIFFCDSDLQEFLDGVQQN